MFKSFKPDYKFVIAVLTLLLLCSLSGEVLSQTVDELRNITNNNDMKPVQSESIEWSQLVTLVGATGLISVVGSGIFNRYNTNKQLKEQQNNALRQLDRQREDAITLVKRDRQIAEIQDKLNLYAAFTFDLKVLRELMRNSACNQLDIRLNEIQKNIDLLIRPKFYLLGPEIIRGWLEVNRDYRNLNSVRKLLDSLITEYNTKIRPRYLELIGTDLGSLED